MRGESKWGQWGCGRVPCGNTAAGNFVNPNLRNQYIGHVIEEGLRAEHQSSPLDSVELGDPLQFGGHSFAVAFAGDLATADPDPRYAGMEKFTSEQNRLLVFRRNRALSYVTRAVIPLELDCHRDVSERLLHPI